MGRAGREALRMEMDSLAEIADRYGCDKGLAGPSTAWSANNYVDVYEALFHQIRLEPLEILEIGIGVSGESWDAKVAHGINAGGGASLRTWAEYFPNARIHGLDINDASHLDSDRILTYRVDQSNRSELREFLVGLGDVELDIVIDDGSHRSDHQQISLEVIWPHLRQGRHYFIEDLNDHGFGGDSRGPHASADAVPTRSFFREFRSTGNILEPNAFESKGFLDEIDDLTFYCPRPFLRAKDVAIELLRVMLGRNVKGLLRTEYSQTSHRVLALRKRVACL